MEICITKGCTGERVRRDWCSSCYQRGMRNGTIPRVNAPRGTDKTTAFWRRVDRSGDCWEWTGAQGGRGYGYFDGHPSGHRLTHRISWAVTNGPIPAGIYVCHQCDNPRCVRPDHLFLGTHRENTDDMMTKGRQPSIRGVRNGHSRLTEDDVRAIRADVRPYPLIAADYGIHRSHVSDIKNRKRWAHIA